MKEARRQAWIGYAHSLAIAVFMSVVVVPFVPLPSKLNRFVLGAFASFVFGTAFFALTAIGSRVRMRTFGLNVLIRTLLTTATVLLSFFITEYGFVVAEAPSQLWDVRLFGEVCRFVVLGQWPTCILTLLLSALVNFGFQIDRKLGPGVLLNWLTGKYYTPREEERIFMFLDMKDSTAIAERLGTIKFSALVRDFFGDLTYPILETRAAVSHYIGDEAVIYWSPAEGLRDANCLQLFFKVRRTIEARAGYYQDSYGLVPEFKAGVHMGPVVATEVGELKSEIVFHGDTLNTAARIQGLCGELGPLLISDAVASKLTAPAGLTLESVGPKRLKGKAQEVDILAVFETDLTK